MEEETLFQKPAVNQNQGNTPPVESSVPFNPSPPPPPPPVVDNPPLIVPPPPPPHRNGLFSSLMSGKLIKILLGFLVMAAIFALIFTVILPKLRGEENKQVTLTYWGLWEDEGIMQSVIKDFETKNPNIKINYSKQDIKQYRERLQTRIANGTGPDIFKFHNTWYLMLSSDLLPLPTEVITRNEFTNRFYNVARDDLIKNGAIYGVPSNMDTLSLFVNTGKLQAGGYEIPATWNDFISVASSLTVKNSEEQIETSGAAIGTFENISHAPDIISLLFAQNGVDLQNIQRSEQRVADALNFYTDFANGEDNIWNSSLDSSILAFSQGNVAMIFGYSWDYFTIKALNPDLNFQIASVPQLSTETSKNIASYWADGISSKSKNQKEALLFLKFLTSQESQQKLYTEESKTREFGELYADRGLAATLESSQNVSVFVKQAETAVSSYFVDSTYDGGLNEKLNNYLKDAVNSTLNSSSAQSATSALFEGASQVMSQYDGQNKK